MPGGSVGLQWLTNAGIEIGSTLVDLATLLGLVGGSGIVLAAILLGGSAVTFLNAP